MLLSFYDQQILEHILLCVSYQQPSKENYSTEPL